MREHLLAILQFARFLLGCYYRDGPVWTPVELLIGYDMSESQYFIMIICPLGLVAVNRMAWSSFFVRQNFRVDRTSHNNTIINYPASRESACLSENVFPWDCPFNHPGSIARGGFKHLIQHVWTNRGLHKKETPRLSHDVWQQRYIFWLFESFMVCCDI